MSGRKGVEVYREKPSKCRFESKNRFYGGYVE